MLKYVVIFSIGPVQTFIASARRSRELWSGSWLLSELAKACAKSLNDLGDTKAQLIFPHVDKNNQADLEENSDFSVGNKVQVVLTVDSVDELKDIIDNAKESVKNALLKKLVTLYHACQKTSIIYVKPFGIVSWMIIWKFRRLGQDLVMIIRIMTLHKKRVRHWLAEKQPEIFLLPAPYRKRILSPHWRN